MSENVKAPIFVLAASFLWASLAASAPTGVRMPVGQARGVVTAHVEESSPGFLDVVLTLTRPASPNGLGLAVAFDSKRLHFIGASDLFQEGFVGVSAAAEKDSADLDGDPATDRLVRLGWIDPSGRWAARLRDVVIARLRFDTAAGGVPAVSVVPLSGELEHRFAPLRLSDLAFVEVPDVLPRTAAAFRGLATSGADSAATGAAAVTATAAATTLPCSPDADGNGRLDALTDGVLIVRYLMGLRDAALVSGATGTGATRTSGALVTSFLANADCLPMLDADANAARDALTDGVLIARWLFGFADQALVNGALGTGATRTASGAIASYLVYYSNPREPVVQAVLKAGESAQDTYGQVQVKAVDAAATVTVVSGTNDEGGRTFDFQTSAPVTLEITLPSAATMAATSARPDVGTLAPDAAPYHSWGTTTVKWFAGIPLHNRLPETKQGVPVVVPPCVIAKGGAAVGRALGLAAEVTLRRDRYGLLLGQGGRRLRPWLQPRLLVSRRQQDVRGVPPPHAGCGLPRVSLRMEHGGAVRGRCRGSRRSHRRRRLSHRQAGPSRRPLDGRGPRADAPSGACQQRSEQGSGNGPDPDDARDASLRHRGRHTLPPRNRTAQGPGPSGRPVR